MVPAQVLRHEPYADERLWEAVVAGPYERGVPSREDVASARLPKHVCPVPYGSSHLFGRFIIACHLHRLSIASNKMHNIVRQFCQGCRPAGLRWRGRSSR